MSFAIRNDHNDKNNTVKEAVAFRASKSGSDPTI